MTEEMINLGEQYLCKPIGFTKTVMGEVVSKMTNCAVVKVALIQLSISHSTTNCP